MAPSIFARMTQEPSPPRPSRFKTISAFLNPFNPSSNASTSSAGSSFATAGVNAPSSIFQAIPTTNTFGKHPIPSAPLPYQGVKSDISLSDLGHIALGGSPFKVYIRERDEGLPSAGFSTPNSGRRVGMVNGLPVSHHPLAALHGDGAKFDQSAEKNGSRQMPTLASAIHIADTGCLTNIASTSSKPLPAPCAIPAKPASIKGMSRSKSSTESIFDAYKNRRELKRSASRSSTKQTSSELQSQLAQLVQANTGSMRPRRMSRRLSFDSIRHTFAGGKKQDRASIIVKLSEEPKGATTSEKLADIEPPKPHRLALPPMRGLRNKFSVGPRSTATVAGAKMDVAARKRIHEWEANAKHMRQHENADSGVASMGSVVGRGVLKRMEGAAAHPLQEPMAAQSPTQHHVVASLPSEAELHLPKNDQRRTSMLAHPSLSPHALSPQGGHLAAQTPAPGFGTFLAPSLSSNSLFSPARDDMSMLDPSRSPFFGSSTDDLTSFSALPSPPPRAHPAAPLEVINVNIDPLVSIPDRIIEAEPTQIATRKQSLSEIRKAFTRMRDYTGLDLTSDLGSAPPSRPTSEIITGDGLTSGISVVSDPEVERPFDIEPASGARLSQSNETSSDTLAAAQQSVPPTPPTIIGQKEMIDHSTATAKTLASAASISSSIVTVALGTEADDVDAATEEGMSQAQSGRSWHTAQDDLSLSHLPAVLPGHYSRTLPRSKSRSTHDIASLASSRNLVDDITNAQGEGWWSVERPREIARRASTVDLLQSRRKSELEGDRRIELLEKLAKTSALPHRDYFAEGGAPGTPTRRTPGRYNDETFRPRSVMDGRTRTILSNRTKDAALDWRPTSVQVRPRASYACPRPSPATGGAWRHEAREGLERRGSYLAMDDTPTRPSVRNQFATSRIGPDIARRASCLTGRSSSDREEESTACSSPIKSRYTDDVNTKEIQSGLMGSTDEMDQKYEEMKAKHVLELDAILGALAGCKGEIKSLQEEVGGYKSRLASSEAKRNSLAEKVEALQGVIEELEGRSGQGQLRDIGPSTRGRSLSVTSSILPDLSVPDVSLVMHVSPLEPLAHLSPDEFGRKRDFDLDMAVRSRRSVRLSKVIGPRPLSAFHPSHDQRELEIQAEQGSVKRGKNAVVYGRDGDRSMSHSLLDDDTMSVADEDVDDAWTLRLRSSDEAHLDDM